MKRIRKFNCIICLFLMFFCDSCKNDCIDFHPKSQTFYNTYKEIQEKDTSVFHELGKIIDGLILKNQHFASSKKFISYSIKPTKCSNSGINVQDKILSRLLLKLNCNKLVINYEMSSNSIPLVLLYPNGLEKYNLDDSCPYFSSELIYSPNKKYFSSSPNWLYFKLNTEWYLRTSIRSL